MVTCYNWVIPTTTIDRHRQARAATPGGGYFDAAASAVYTALTTFKRDGTPVVTPVHLVAEPDGGVAYFRTWGTAGKAKRLRRKEHVTVAPSTFRGRTTGAAVKARARMLEGEEARHAARLLRARHPILHGFLIPRYHRLRGWRTVPYALTPVPTTPAT